MIELILKDGHCTCKVEGVTIEVAREVSHAIKELLKPLPQQLKKVALLASCLDLLEDN